MPPRSDNKKASSRKPVVRRGPNDQKSQQTKFASASFVLIFGTLLTWIFWSVLWQGGGLIGGDIYPYYLPQKALLAESLQEGKIPLWNPYVGFGYPVLGESQTGALYPPNLVLYRLFDLNTAYNLNQILHYIGAFFFTWALSRRLGLNQMGSLLTAVTFVYGWFPARICWEWCIIGGTWFVAVLWAATGFLQSGRQRDLGLLSLFLAMSLLAGHYNLAFISLLMLLPLPWLVSRSPLGLPASPVRNLLSVGLAIGLGFLIAGVQLAPSWELKSLSQRQEQSTVFTPTEGHLPVQAVSQLWNPWGWYNNQLPMDAALQQSKFLAVPSPTNQVEAQLYIGIFPFSLVFFAILLYCFKRSPKSLPLSIPIWTGVAVVSLFFATGWPTYFLSSLPGIGFFRGPGRYSVIAVLALALLAGQAWDMMVQKRKWNGFTGWIATGLVLIVVTYDLYGASRQYQLSESPLNSRQVFYTTLLDDPPIRYLEQSELKQFLKEAGDRVRLYAPGANMPSLLGVSSLPVYLGLGPELYELDDLQFDFTETAADDIEKRVHQLQQLGITHLLLQQPIDTELWPVTFMGARFDQFLNRAFARIEPFYLYHLPDSSGRAEILPASNTNRIVEMQTTSRGVTQLVEHQGEVEVILRDLTFPGWQVKATSAESPRETDPVVHLTNEGHFRKVTLPSNDSTSIQRVTLEWSYRPSSLYVGMLMSFAGVIGLIGWCFVSDRTSLLRKSK